MASKKDKRPRRVAKKAEQKPRTFPYVAEVAPDPPKKRKGKTRIQLFINEYLIDLNGRQAAIRAGYSELSARQSAADLLAMPEVQAAVTSAMEARSKRTEITQDKVLKRMWAVATADAADIIDVRRTCCRYCYGINNLYQRTSREMQNDLRAFERQRMDAESKNQNFALVFDEQGGIGFNPTLDPSSKCPECFGVGVETIIAKDTRDLPPEARLLYAGAKTTQHGLEIKVHDQAAMLVNVGKHLGMFVNKVENDVRITSIQGILEDIDGSDTGPGPASSRRAKGKAG